MIHAVIIDDELGGRENLRDLLKENFEDVRIAALADSPAEGLRAIRSFDPDLVFLDIEMPGENGFEMLKKIDNIDFEVIFVTAYDHYAIQAIQFSALDYLLKPVGIENLRPAMERAVKKISEGKRSKKQFDTLFANIGPGNKRPKIIALPDAQGLLFVDLSEIVRLESKSNQTCFSLQDKRQISVHKTLREYEEFLGEGFFRCHKAHLINLDHIRKYMKGDGGEILMSDGTCVELSRRKKEEFLKRYSPS